jgi:FHA domain
MIKCTECGYENMDGLDYCDGCGAKLAAAEGAAVPAPAPAAAHEATPAPSSVGVSDPPSAATAPAMTSSEHPAAHEAAAPASATDGTAVSAETAPQPASEARTGEITPSEAAPTAAAAAAPAAAAHFKVKLSLLRGGRKGQEFPLDGGQNFIGRWDPETGSFPEVDLEQDDPEAKISRKHALIIIEGGKITIEDIGSLNGTYVNRGNRLIPGTPLEIKAGDEVIIGKTFLKLVVDPIS